MDLGLTGRTCVVTGGSQGIGKGAAIALAGEGANVVIVARSADSLTAAADSIAAEGYERPHVIAADLSEAAAPAEICREVMTRFGRADVLVNSAGGSRKLEWDAPDSAWEEGLSVNFHAIRRLTNEFLPFMRSAGFGRIVNVTGTSEPLSVNAASSAKAAVHAWAKGLSREVAAEGVTINSVSPGIIRSQQIMERVFRNDEDRLALIKEQVPAGYMGEPEDIACLIAFLASARARYITGCVVHVDGGSRRFAF